MPQAVLAKKLYKYQDEQGRWHFADKPPNTDLPVEVRQMKPSQKQLVKLQKSGPPDAPTFYLLNDYAGPIEVAVDWENRNQASAEPALPQRFVVDSGQSPPLLTIKGMQGASQTTFTLQYRYVLGQPLPTYTTSTTTYLPPLAPGSRFQISQAFEGPFSHQDVQNRYAVDISMPIGTPIHAARAGRVMAVENDFYLGGTLPAYIDKANSIRILHEDGSMALYAHLALEKALVHPGLEVKAGELIGYSGNTGFTSGPHLHFAVQINRGMELVSVPFKFMTAGQHSFEPMEGQWLAGIPATP